LQTIVGVVEGLKGETWEQFRDRYGDSGRDLVLWLGRTRGGFGLRELGQLAGGLDYTSVSLAVKRFEKRRVRVKSLREMSQRTEQTLIAQMSNVDSAEKACAAIEWPVPLRRKNFAESLNETRSARIGSGSMSLPALDAQSQLFCTAATSDQLFSTADRYRLFAQQVYPLLLRAREEIAKAYCASNGRPAVEPVLLLGVTLLQYLEGAPDRQAVDLLRYHAGWNFALNRNLGEAVFHPTVLVYFRDRLQQHELSQVVFANMLEALMEAGLVERRARQRLDSTQMLGLVAHMSRLENVRATLRLALKELELSTLAFAKPSWWTQVWERYVDSKLDYRTPVSVLMEKMSQAAVDGLLVRAWAQTLSDKTVAERAQVKLLARVLEENFTWEEGKAPVQREAQPTGAVHNPHDPQAQWAAKGQGKRRKEHVGYKVQVAESVHVEPLAKGEPTRSFITGMVTHAASASDEGGAELIQEQQTKMGMGKPTELYVDGAYVSAQKLAQAQAEGRQIIGPAQRGITKDNRFSVEQFEVRVEERKAICPAGRENTQCSRLEEQDTGTVTYRFEWSTHCRDCALKTQCIAANQKHRTLLVGQYHSHLQERRKEQKTEEFQKKSQRRNAVEGTQSELVRAHGLRQARYRGLEKARLQNYFAGAACNAKRWIRRMIWEMKRARASMEPALMSG
jgi:transposase